MRIPQILLASEEIHLSPKQEDDQQMGSPEADFGLEAGATGGLRPRQMIRAKILWEKYLRQFDQVDSEHLTGSLEAALLQLPSNVSSRTLDRYVDRSSREQLIKTVSLQLMSTPAYQLC